MGMLESLDFESGKREAHPKDSDGKFSGPISQRSERFSSLDGFPFLGAAFRSVREATFRTSRAEARGRAFGSVEIVPSMGPFPPGSNAGPEAAKRGRSGLPKGRRDMTHACKLAALVALAGTASIVLAGPPGDPNDMYLTSDSAHEIYQFERTSPYNYVQGVYNTSTPVPGNKVFSNSSQVGFISPYLACVAGTTNEFWIGGFGGMTRINSSTGAVVSTPAGGQRLGPSKALNGNVIVGGPSGVEEFDGNTGAFVRTVAAVGDGRNLVVHEGNEVFTANWDNQGFGIKRNNFVTGLTSGADIVTPFRPQEISFGPDGRLYASANYYGSGGGVYRYDMGTSTWSLWADTTVLGQAGPHGFAWDPSDLSAFYTAQPTGEVYKFDGTTGAFLGSVAFVPTKLTDLLFQRQVPAPGTLALVGLAGVFAGRRRR